MRRILLLTALTCYAGQKPTSTYKLTKTQTKSNTWLYTGAVVAGTALIAGSVLLWRNYSSYKLDRDAYYLSEGVNIFFTNRSIYLALPNTHSSGDPITIEDVLKNLQSDKLIKYATAQLLVKEDAKIYKEKLLDGTKEEYVQKLREKLTYRNIALTENKYSKKNSWRTAIEDYEQKMEGSMSNSEAYKKFLIATCLMDMIKADLERTGHKIDYYTLDLFYKRL